MAFKALALGVKLPPADEDQIPPVAEPPTLPENGLEAPP